MSRERITASSFTLSAPGGGESLVGRGHFRPATTRRPADRERLAAPAESAPTPPTPAPAANGLDSLAKRLGLTGREVAALRSDEARLDALNALLADGGASDATLRAAMRGQIHPTAIRGRS